MDESSEWVTRWIEEAPSMLDVLATGLVERERLREAFGAAERDGERLREELAVLRSEFGALRDQNVRLVNERRELAAMLTDVLAKLGAAAVGLGTPAAAAPAEPAPQPVISPVAAVPADPPPVACGAPGRERYRLLLVNTLSTISNQLITDRGYDVLAVSGTDAPARIADFRPHIVVIDLVMPRSGMEALKRIKALYPELGVIVMTSVEDAALARQALAVGAADYLTKPVDLGYLDAMLAIYMVGDNMYMASSDMRSTAAPDSISDRGAFAAAIVAPQAGRPVKRRLARA